MRWVQWTPHEVAQKVGGVEVHIRSVDRELRSLGIQSQFTSDILSVTSTPVCWNVVLTHGCWPLPESAQKMLKNSHSPPLRLHVFHGSTLGRMGACGEWLWLGGYRAYAKEWQGLAQADAVLGVHEGIHFLNFSRLARKPVAVCGNGWDSAGDVEVDTLGEWARAQFQRLNLDPTQSVCFVGRGRDPVKNSDFTLELLKKFPALKLLAIPGEGFEGVPSSQVVRFGSDVSPAQVRALVRESLGLWLLSHYEGLPLVVLEALSDGVPVLASRVGGVAYLSSKLQNLAILPLSRSLGDWVQAWQKLSSSVLEQSRSQVAQHNRSRLRSWEQVARILVETASQLRSR